MTMALYQLEKWQSEIGKLGTKVRDNRRLSLRRSEKKRNIQHLLRVQFMESNERSNFFDTLRIRVFFA